MSISGGKLPGWQRIPESLSEHFRFNGKIGKKREAEAYWRLFENPTDNRQSDRYPEAARGDLGTDAFRFQRFWLRETSEDGRSVVKLEKEKGESCASVILLTVRCSQRGVPGSEERIFAVVPLVRRGGRIEQRPLTDWRKGIKAGLRPVNGDFKIRESKASESYEMAMCLIALGARDVLCIPVWAVDLFHQLNPQALQEDTVQAELHAESENPDAWPSDEDEGHGGGQPKAVPEGLAWTVVEGPQGVTAPRTLDHGSSIEPQLSQSVPLQSAAGSPAHSVRSSSRSPSVQVRTPPTQNPTSAQTLQDSGRCASSPGSAVTVPPCLLHTTFNSPPQAVGGHLYHFVTVQQAEHLHSQLDGLRPHEAALQASCEACGCWTDDLKGLATRAFSEASRQPAFPPQDQMLIAISRRTLRGGSGPGRARELKEILSSCGGTSGGDFKVEEAMEGPSGIPATAESCSLPLDSSENYQRTLCFRLSYARPQGGSAAGLSLLAIWQERRPVVEENHPKTPSGSQQGPALSEQTHSGGVLMEREVQQNCCGSVKASGRGVLDRAPPRAHGLGQPSPSQSNDPSLFESRTATGTGMGRSLSENEVEKESHTQLERPRDLCNDEPVGASRHSGSSSKGLLSVTDEKNEARRKTLLGRVFDLRDRSTIANQIRCCACLTCGLLVILILLCIVLALVLLRLPPLEPRQGGRVKVDGTPHPVSSTPPPAPVLQQPLAPRPVPSSSSPIAPPSTPALRRPRGETNAGGRRFNATLPSNETAQPPALIEDRQPSPPSNTTLPSNETSQPPALLEDSQPSPPSNTTLPSNETAQPPALLEDRQPSPSSNTTLSSNETAQPPALLEDSQPSPSSNTTLSSNETAQPPALLEDRQPSPPSNTTLPSNETAQPPALPPWLRAWLGRGRRLKQNVDSHINWKVHEFS